MRHCDKHNYSLIAQSNLTPRHRQPANYPRLAAGRALRFVLLGLTFSVLFILVLIQLSPAFAAQSQPVWMQKPILTYFALTGSLEQPLIAEVGLTEEQFALLRQVAADEAGLLQDLGRSSQGILRQKSLSLDSKKQAFEIMAYNQRMMDIERSKHQLLLDVLGAQTYHRLVQWIETRWTLEKQIHASPLSAAGPRTFRIYATRYDSGGAYTVALPDKCVKFSNAGNSICKDDGYIAGGNYSVSLGYDSYVTVRVLESGPWNVDDTYWSSLSDPQPRRMFTDLAVGMPEAQAAYFNNYNGGKDQFGRIVSAPFGIDLARQVSIDIGLQPGINDWIDVTFLWTADWGNPSGDGASSLPPVLDFIIPVEVATPLPDGSIVHEVQQGQALLHISKAYQVELETILELNHLSVDALIYPGDKLLIKAPRATETPEPSTTPTPRITNTLPATKTPTVKLTEPLSLELNSATLDLTPTQDRVENPSTTREEPFLTVIAVLVVVGGVLVFLGNILRRQSRQAP